MEPTECFSSAVVQRESEIGGIQVYRLQFLAVWERPWQRRISVGSSLIRSQGVTKSAKTNGFHFRGKIANVYYFVFGNDLK